MNDEIDSPEYKIYGGSFYICRMNTILPDVETGNQYMIQPSVQELEDGIIQYVPEPHAHLLDYIMFDGQLYSKHPDLVDWDQGVEEWKESVMGQWPFGIQLSVEQKLINEAFDWTPQIPINSLRNGRWTR